MSGMFMIRRDNCVELYADGGCFQSTSDFSVKGFISKPIHLPHINSVVCSIGTHEIAVLLQHNQQQKWTSYDQMAEVMSDGILAEVESLFAMSSRQRIDVAVIIGGYSESRAAWHSQMFHVNAERFTEPCVHVFDNEMLFAPTPTDEALNKFGIELTPESLREPDAPFRFMQALRASKQPMGGIENGASTIAGFLERVIVMHDQTVAQVIWRWPDEVGRLVDPSVEGEPTAIYHQMFGPEDEAAAEQ